MCLSCRQVEDRILDQNVKKRMFFHFFQRAVLLLKGVLVHSEFYVHGEALILQNHIESAIYFYH